MQGETPKPVFWISSSRKDMRGLPVPVRRRFGLSLFAVQLGDTPPAAKPLRGFGGAGVLELIEDDKGSTYRAVYTVRFREAIYVLHVFQKKSKQGAVTPKHEMGLVRDRLKLAQEHHARQAQGLKS
jgi:phage-related protein